MTKRIALLRGINVGGRSKVAMADLRQMFTDLGLESVKTVLQSGNVVFEGGPGGADLEEILERETEKRLGLRPAYLIREAEDWRNLVTSNPFPEEAKNDPVRLQAMPLKAAPKAAAVAALREAIVGSERVEAVGRELYLYYPDGSGRSKLTIKLIESKLGTQGTSRNWNTVMRLAALIGD